VVKGGRVSHVPSCLFQARYEDGGSAAQVREKRGEVSGATMSLVTAGFRGGGREGSVREMPVVVRWRCVSVDSMCV
jgi:hypothetical protein